MATDGLDPQGMHVAFGDNWTTDINIDPSCGQTTGPDMDLGRGCFAYLKMKIYNSIFSFFDVR